MGWTMGNQNGNRMKAWDLKAFLTVSLGIHLFFFSMTTLLFPDFKINIRPPHISEVTLLPPPLPVIVEEKPLPKMISSPLLKTQIKKEEKNPLQNESKEEPVNQKEQTLEPPLPSRAELKLTLPINVPPAPSPPHEEGRMVIASHGPSIPMISSSGEFKKGAKYPSYSDGEIIRTQPKYAENPKPLYPLEARKKGYEGEVVLRVEVLSNGRVNQVEVKKSSGYELLDRSALHTVKGWKFIPAKKGESPIPLWVNIPIKFTLTLH